MKKMYNQPIVETTKVQAISLMQVASPKGVGGGGDTGDIPGSGGIGGD